MEAERLVEDARVLIGKGKVVESEITSFDDLKIQVAQYGNNTVLNFIARSEDLKFGNMGIDGDNVTLVVRGAMK